VVFIERSVCAGQKEGLRDFPAAVDRGMEDLCIASDDYAERHMLNMSADAQDPCEMGHEQYASLSRGGFFIQNPVV
jgi:hypothetical protein